MSGDEDLGVGLAAAVLIDAVVVRGMVLPSLMTLLGRAKRWPPWLPRRDRWHALAEVEGLPEPVGPRA